MCCASPGATCSRRGHTSPHRPVPARPRMTRARPATDVGRVVRTGVYHQTALHLLLARARRAPRVHNDPAGARGGNVASGETNGPTVDDPIDAAPERLQLDG